MAMNKMIGGALLAAGGGLLVWGYQLYGELGNKFARALGSSTSSETLIVLGGGLACVVAGVVMLTRK